MNLINEEKINRQNFEEGSKEEIEERYEEIIKQIEQEKTLEKVSEER